jgi:hypothetical protein
VDGQFWDALYNNMRISNEILAVLVGAVLALQGWELLEIVNLKTSVAVLEVNQHMHIAQTSKP